MIIRKTFEKDEVQIEMFQNIYWCHLIAEVEIEYTPPSDEVRASDNSCLIPPSGATVAVMWAETTLTIFCGEDAGKEMGTLVLKGSEWFESLYGYDIEVDEGVVL